MAFGEIVYTEDEVTKLLPLKLRSGLPPTDPTNVVLDWGEDGMEISFSAPDTIIEDQRLCTVAGALILFKAQYPPTNISDGTYIANLTAEEIEDLSEDPFIFTGAAPEVDNYIWIIPYSDHEAFNDRTANIYKLDAESGV